MFAKVIKFFAYVICYLFYPLSFCFPRDKNIYVFGAFRGAFVDNPKYLFIYCNEHHFGKQCIWISPSKETVKRVRELGFRAYYVGSLKGIYYSLRAKYWFINCYTSDILFCLSGGAIVINLWHGVPMKCIEFGITKGELKKRYVDRDFWDVFYHPAPFRKPDWFASTTPFFDTVFSHSFRINKHQCLHVGCARNQMLIESLDDTRKFINKNESIYIKQLISRIEAYKKVYIYMPTWRDSQLNIFANGIDLRALNNTMEQQNSVILMKPHINTKIDKTQKYSNLIFINGDVDVYPILPFTDVLISDYSGTIYDYLLMPNKGIILFHYDYEEYVKEREFIFDIDQYIAGKRVYSFEELLHAIVYDDHVVDPIKREQIITMFWGETMRQNICGNIIHQLHLST